MSKFEKNKNKNKKDVLARIKVIGVGGGGGNAVTRMNQAGLLKHVELIAINTDAQDLDACEVKKKIYIGKNLTQGLGTGMNADIGRQAAEESRSEILEALRDSDLVFITAGLGGGTGTGASPVVAEIAREVGALTIAVVTKPFTFEGAQRAKITQEGLTRLKDKVDTMVVVPNDKIFNIINKNTSLVKAFQVIDDVLNNAVQTVTDLITIPGLINIDFADIKTIMKDAGLALVGVGIASGGDRSVKAVNAAVNSPLLEVSLEGSKGILFCVSGRDIKMNEVNDVAKTISEAMDPDAKVIFGAYSDRRQKAGFLKVAVIANGFNGSLSDRPSGSLFSLGTAVSGAGHSVKSGLADKNTAKENAQNIKSEEKNVKNPKKDSDIWDIPAFMRRRKR